MPSLSRVFKWGRVIQGMGADLYNQLSKAYTSTADIVNTKVSKRIISGENPPASNEVNKNYDIGDVWVRTDTNAAWMMTSRTSSTAVTWTLIT